MKRYRLYNRTQAADLGPARRAAGFVGRLCGLIGKNPDHFHEGLWIVPCCGVHTLGMRHPLDIVFLNRGGEVLRLAANIRPFSPGVVCAGAHSVLEFFSGEWDRSKVAVGDRLDFLEEGEVNGS